MSVELQEVVQSSAHNENSALMEETYRYAAVPVDEETVREQGFTKRSLPVILFAILFVHRSNIEDACMRNSFSMRNSFIKLTLAAHLRHADASILARFIVRCHNRLRS